MDAGISRRCPTNDGFHFETFVIVAVTNPRFARLTLSFIPMPRSGLGVIPHFRSCRTLIGCDGFANGLPGVPCLLFTTLNIRMLQPTCD